MITRIVVPLDGSRLAEQVLPYVRLLSRAAQAHIVLLQAIEPASPNLIALPGRASQVQITEGLRNQVEKYLEEVAASLRMEGLVALPKVIEGHPASGIVDEGKQEVGTLIAMSTHGRSGITRWRMGSITDKVLHAVTNPLLMVRAQEPEEFNPEVKLTDIIVPLDGSALAEQVLPLAVSITRDLGMKMTLLRVAPSVQSYYPFIGTSAEYYTDYDYNDLVREIDEEVAQYLIQLGSRLRQEGISTVEEQLMHGSAEIAITDYARQVPHCLVAMTTHGRSGMGRWVLGSVADRTIRDSGAPVLVVRSSEQ
jgi:nucleotide-binding universal stress UspA family protein